MQLARYRYDIQTPPILSGSPRFFGGGRTYAPGVYRIRYANGAMLYAGGPPLWSVADPLTAGRGFYFRAPDAGVQVFAPQVLNGGGTGQVYATAEECRAAHLLLPPVDLTVPAPSRLTVYLDDDPYWDNTTGPLGPPSWWFVGRVGPVVAPPPPAEIQTITSTWVTAVPENYWRVVVTLPAGVVITDVNPFEWFFYDIFSVEYYATLEGFTARTITFRVFGGNESDPLANFFLPSASLAVTFAVPDVINPDTGPVPYP